MKTKQRTKDIYGNWKILAPDGDLLFLTLKKRADWYLNKGLAKLIGEETIQLTFEPKNRSSKDDQYNLALKENKCVVCGTTDIEVLTRHHIIPYEYRKFFPEELKSRSSHDVVPICREHHNEYELVADNLKKDILMLYEVYDKLLSPCVDKSLKLSKLLLNNIKLPDDRMEQVKADFTLYSGVEDLTEENIRKYCEIHKNHKKLSELVIEKVIERCEIESFIKMWRKHFVDIMNPKFMPMFWDINRKI